MKMHFQKCAADADEKTAVTKQKVAKGYHETVECSEAKTCVAFKTRYGSMLFLVNFYTLTCKLPCYQIYRRD